MVLSLLSLCPAIHGRHIPASSSCSLLWPGYSFGTCSNKNNNKNINNWWALSDAFVCTTMQIVLTTGQIVLPLTIMAVPAIAMFYVVLCSIAHGCVIGTYYQIDLLLCWWWLSHLVCGTASGRTLQMASLCGGIGKFNWSNDDNNEDNHEPNINGILVMMEEQWELALHWMLLCFAWIVGPFFICISMVETMH